jgi:DNA-binding XRE family transcriptional regulator
MLKTAASIVLASLERSTYNPHVRLAFSLAAALLDDAFEHSAQTEGH